jgi:hypothetical protein
VTSLQALFVTPAVVVVLITQHPAPAVLAEVVAVEQLELLELLAQIIWAVAVAVEPAATLATVVQVL